MSETAETLQLHRAACKIDDVHVSATGTERGAELTRHCVGWAFRSDLSFPPLE